MEVGNQIVNDVSGPKTDDILWRAGGELSELAAKCCAIQNSLSRVLDLENSQATGADLAILQDIDMVEQTLHDLSKFLNNLAPLAEGLPNDINRLGGDLKLSSLMLRLFGQDQKQSDSELAYDQDSDITWF